MKIRINFSVIILISLFFSLSIFSQEFITHYNTSEVFDIYEKPINLAIIKFNSTAAYEDSLWEQLQYEDNWRHNFTIYPFETIRDFIENFEDNDSLLYDQKLWSMLKNDFEINFVMGGQEKENGDIEIEIIDINSTKTIFNHIFKRSLNSTIIDDLFKLLNNGQLAEFKLKKRENLDLDFVLVKDDSLKVTSDFYISKYECTIAKFDEFVSSTGHTTDAEEKGYSIIYSKNRFNVSYDSVANINWRFDEKGLLLDVSSYDKYPVLYTSWNDANAYCKWLSNETGSVYRLPSEIEWELAYDYINLNEDDYLDSISNYYDIDNSLTLNVGQKKANKNGIYDLIGNAAEWSNDSTVNSNNYKILGGSFLSEQVEFKVKSKVYKPSEYNANFIGFRIVREVGEK